MLLREDSAIILFIFIFSEIFVRGVVRENKLTPKINRVGIFLGLIKKTSRVGRIFCQVITRIKDDIFISMDEMSFMYQA